MFLRLRKILATIVVVSLAVAAAILHYGMAYHYAHIPLRSVIVPRPYPRVGQAVDGLIFSHNGKRLIAADTQTGMSQWTIPELHFEDRTKQSVSDEVSALSLSPDGNTITLADNSRVRSWAVSRNGFASLPVKQVAFRRSFGKNEYWNAFQFHTVSPSGKLAAGADAEGDVVVWNVQTGRRLYAEDAHPAGQYGYPTKFCDIAFSPDDRLMATSLLAGDDPVPSPAFQIAIRDVQTGQLVRHWYWAKADIPNVDDRSGGVLGQTGLVFSPDGLAVAVADARHVAIWDTRTGELRQTLAVVNGSFGIPKRLVFFHNGALLVGCGWGNPVPIWNVKTGALVQIFYADEATEAVAVSPNNHLLATSGQSTNADGRIELWNISRIEP